MTEGEKLLQHEREKLNRPVDEALQKGTPINETHEIGEQFRRIRIMREAVLAQSRRVDRLVVMVEKEKEKEG